MGTQGGRRYQNTSKERPQGTIFKEDKAGEREGGKVERGGSEGGREGRAVGAHLQEAVQVAEVKSGDIGDQGGAVTMIKERGSVE